MSNSQLTWPKHPKIYEINTWPWLNTLSDVYSTQITLKNIPDEIINREIKLFDAVWLMGVWERSPASKRIALEHPGLLNEFHSALHEFNDENVVGSPYAVYYYHIENKLGGIDGLKKTRKQLSDNEIRLILDYVPNHVSIDSLWTLEPNLFIEGTLNDLMQHPEEFFSISGEIYAHGRDPNFPAWTDTIQLNVFSKEVRKKTINTLLNIAELCDGVRCDMAMLLTNKVFNRTWGEKAGSVPKEEYWEEVISSVKERFPNFLFIAEVYWDMEWELLQQGFDYCYDKRLYERLKSGEAKGIRDHLNADWDYQRRLVRFIENHDELRAMEKFGFEKSRAAAIIALTLPGARLVHEGQMKGYKIKLPVQLDKRQIEEVDQNLLKFYINLLKIDPGNFRNAKWALCNLSPIDSADDSYRNLVSYLWWSEDAYQLFVVNFSSSPSKAHLKSDNLEYGFDEWMFKDLLNNKEYVYKGEDLNKYGLYIDLEAWNGHIFNIKKKLG
jgi:glycosidase